MIFRIVSFPDHPVTLSEFIFFSSQPTGRVWDTRSAHSVQPIVQLPHREFSRWFDSRPKEEWILYRPQLFADIQKAGNTVILVTHEEDIAACAERTVRLRDGRVESDS